MVGAWKEPGRGEWAYRRIGRMVGRKSRRAPDGPSRSRVSAPDLSRAVEIRPRGSLRPENAPSWTARRTPTPQILLGLASKRLPLSAPRFSPYHALARPHADPPRLAPTKYQQNSLSQGTLSA